MQLEFKNDDGAPVKTATVKAGGGETETLPLFTNKDTITGEVSCPNSCDVQGWCPRMHEVRMKYSSKY